MKKLRLLRSLPSVVVLMMVLASALGVWNFYNVSRAENALTSGLDSVSSVRQRPMETPARQTALFVGDDFTAWGQGFYTYPYIVCDAFQLNCNVDAQIGTGYANNGQSLSVDNLTPSDRLPKDRTFFEADIIIVDVGRNDREIATDQFNEASANYLAALRGDWPAAKIAVIIPWILSEEQAPDYAEKASVLCQQAEKVAAVCIDPLKEAWLSGVDTSNLHSLNNLRPNQAGHKLIAAKLIESLQQHRLVAVRGTNQ